MKSGSILNELQHFHVIQQMPSDFLHDLHEGLAVDVMSAMLRYLIDEQSSFLLINSIVG